MVNSWQYYAVVIVLYIFDVQLFILQWPVRGHTGRVARHGMNVPASSVCSSSSSHSGSESFKGSLARAASLHDIRMPARTTCVKLLVPSRPHKIEAIALHQARQREVRCAPITPIRVKVAKINVAIQTVLWKYPTRMACYA